MLCGGVYTFTPTGPRRREFPGHFSTSVGLPSFSLVGRSGYLAFVFRVRMISQPFYVTGFNLVSAATLVVFTSLIGYVVGWSLETIMKLAGRVSILRRAAQQTKAA